MDSKIKIANVIAQNHLIYICDMAGRNVIGSTKQYYAALEKQTQSVINRIDSIIETVLSLKTESAWVSAGNHEMKALKWSEFYKMCENA